MQQYANINGGQIRLDFFTHIILNKYRSINEANEIMKLKGLLFKCAFKM